jgi:hypothetical protein
MKKIISYTKLKSMLKSARDIDATLTFNLLSKEEIKYPYQMEQLYYGGVNKIEFSSYFISLGEHFLITNDNFEKIACKIHKLLLKDISRLIPIALKNLCMDDTQLKYFINEPIKFKKFKKEIQRLIKEKQL